MRLYANRTERMQRAVIMSLRPEWAKRILSGEKTMEVRKNFPPWVFIPFTVYIYETNAEGGRGKVVGEFCCDEICDISWSPESGHTRDYPEGGRDCLTDAQLAHYLGERPGFGWHVASVKAYEEPKELGSFRRGEISPWGEEGSDRLHRAPQSWLYVERLEEMA